MRRPKLTRFLPVLPNWKQKRVSLLLPVSLGAVFVLAAGLIIILVSSSMHQQALEEAKAKAIILLGRRYATHRFYSTELKPYLLEWSEPLRDEEYFEPLWMSSTYALREIDRLFQAEYELDYYYKDAAINARSPQNEADEIERAYLAEVNQNPNLPEQSGVMEFNGEPYFYVLSKGEIVTDDCLLCHSTPEAAPGGLVTYYGSTAGFNRRIGEFASVISVRIPLEQAYANADVFTVSLSAFLMFILAALFATQWWLNNQWVFKPLSAIQRFVDSISNDEGKLGSAMDLPGGHETSRLGEAFNELSARLGKNVELLEDRIQQRTGELSRANDALREEIRQRQQVESLLELKSQELERSNLDLEQFALVASHDLQTPLRTTARHLEFIDKHYRENLPEAVNASLSFASQGVGQMRMMITGLLEYSRAGRQTQNLSRVDLQQTLELVIGRMQVIIDDKRARIEIDRLPVVTADETQIQQLFQNLIENSLKYAGSEPPVIKVWTECTGEHRLIHVTDNGLGIDPARIPSLFKLFSRLQPARGARDGVPGSGIGLAICKRIVERHGWEIYAQSALGVGATFTIKLPEPAVSGEQGSASVAKQTKGSL